jgi:hypothetical protein
MTMEQALNYPWRVDAQLTPEDQKSMSSEEAIVKGLGIPRKGVMMGGSLTMPKPKIKRLWNTSGIFS